MQNNNGGRNINPNNSQRFNETDIIRQNEIADRERRQRHAEAVRRKERLKRAKIKRIKTMVKAWATLIGVIAAIIAVIIFVVSAINKARHKEPENPNALSEQTLGVVDSFMSSDSILYSSEENQLLNSANGLVNSFVLSKNTELALPLTSTESSTFLWQAKRYAWCSDRTYLNQVKQIIRDFPIFSNGYVWTSEASMKSEKSGYYLYDTNARFISAVCEIALWEADTSFLYEKDTTSQPRLDVSEGKTVLDKLEMAVNYYFDKNDLNGGGIRYNDADHLVYILTESNNGTSNGAGSNYWFNHRFGYLDAYNNIAFNEAMNHLAQLYTLMGQPEKALEYRDIAEKNKVAVNNTFWNETLGRYIGSKDASGSTHDLGFTFLNLEAISSGIADSNKTESILSWLDGERVISSDTSNGEDIYSFEFVPRSTTVSASDSWWDYVNGNYPLSTDASFGKYWQNGGAALVCEYYDLCARASVSNEEFLTRFNAFSKAYSDGRLLVKNSDSVGINQNAENAVAASMAVYGLFGIDTDGSTLKMSPCLGEYTGYAGIKNIGFGANSYSFLLGETESYVFAEYSGAIRLELGGFEPSASYNVRFAQDGEYTSNEPVTADENGKILISERFGDTSYLIIEKQPDEDKTK